MTSQVYSFRFEYKCHIMKLILQNAKYIFVIVGKALKNKQFSRLFRISCKLILVIHIKCIPRVVIFIVISSKSV